MKNGKQLRYFCTLVQPLMKIPAAFYHVLLGFVTIGGGVAAVNRWAYCVPIQGEPQSHIMVVGRGRWGGNL